MANYRHGVDLLFTNIGAAGVGEIPSGVIALIGTAPAGALNTLVYSKNEKEDAQFGAQVPGFTIPQALSQIRANAGGSGVVVINVFDPLTHTTDVTDEALVLVAGKGKTAFPYVGSVLVKHTSGTPTYVKDVDYSIDAYGNIASLNYTTIAPTASLKLTYKKPNFTAVTSAEVIGSVDGSTGARKGFKLLENSYNTLGLEPKILISPVFGSVTAVVNEMVSWNTRLGAISVVGAPTGTTVVAAKTGRTPSGVINFNLSNKGVYLVYPEVKVYDPATNAAVNRPIEATVAGIIARTDREKGFWKSPSNEEIRGILGLAVPISGSAFNADNDANDLNSVGITTVLSEGPGGFVLWGNRTSAFPAETTPDVFLSVYRTSRIIGRSLQLAARQYVDRPINAVLIDQIRETGNGYIRQLIGRGGLLDGSECVWDEASSDIAAGKLAFIIRIMPPVPAELIELTVAIDVTILNNLLAA